MSDRSDFLKACRLDGIYSGEWILACAGRLHKWAEMECNGEDDLAGRMVDCPNAGVQPEKRCPICSHEAPGHYQVTQTSVRIEKTERLVKGYLPNHEVEFSGDPRGAVVKIRFKNTPGNCFGGGGWYCVPTPEIP
jgi:hypothetical protein